MVDCDSNNFGCNGGYLLLAWNFIQKTGLVEDDCYPYTSGTTKVAGECKSSCANSNKKWKPSKGQLVEHPTSVLLIQQEIQENGPVEAAFTVYEDFMSYAGGVYQHTSGNLLGGHAIKCIGWGHDDASGFDYWLMANSWGTKWGENGFFKIKMGDCGVDKQMYVSRPDHGSDM